LLTTVLLLTEYISVPAGKRLLQPEPKKGIVARKPHTSPSVAFSIRHFAELSTSTAKLPRPYQDVCDFALPLFKRFDESRRKQRQVLPQNKQGFDFPRNPIGPAAWSNASLPLHRSRSNVSATGCIELFQEQSLVCNSEGLSGGGHFAIPHLRFLELPFQKNISGRIQNERSTATTTA
jgi:hypothetical protein